MRLGPVCSQPPPPPPHASRLCSGRHCSRAAAPFPQTPHPPPRPAAPAPRPPPLPAHCFPATLAADAALPPAAAPLPAWPAGASSPPASIISPIERSSSSILEPMVSTFSMRASLMRCARLGWRGGGVEGGEGRWAVGEVLMGAKWACGADGWGRASEGLGCAPVNALNAGPRSVGRGRGRQCDWVSRWRRARGRAMHDAIRPAMRRMFNAPNATPCPLSGGREGPSPGSGFASGPRVPERRRSAPSLQLQACPPWSWITRGGAASTSVSLVALKDVSAPAPAPTRGAGSACEVRAG
jgi:hypothetical protein